MKPVNSSGWHCLSLQRRGMCGLICFAT